MLSEIQLEKINDRYCHGLRLIKEFFMERKSDTLPRMGVGIMLQQTRVEAVKPYFERFTKELPDLRHLAECDEERLLKLWEGLGYYNRVRNMQIAAKTVMEEYQGELPADYEKLLTLKGIGHYTAGAIASIAYGIPVPAVDGNVLRVITRITADDTDIMKQAFRTQMEQQVERIHAKRSGECLQSGIDGIRSNGLCPGMGSRTVTTALYKISVWLKKKGARWHIR